MGRGALTVAAAAIVVVAVSLSRLPDEATGNASLAKPVWKRLKNSPEAGFSVTRVTTKG